jgi:hypothetical protein
MIGILLIQFGLSQQPAKHNIWTSHTFYYIYPGSHTSLINLNTEHSNVHVGDHTPVHIYMPKLELEDTA